jgi:AAA15 family ATPase/GTPase
MLVSYTFSNFRSFKNKTCLSMLAGTQRTLNEVLIKKGGFRILPSAVIYGANASGKSNIIMSLAVMKEIILSGSLVSNNPELTNLELFPFAYSDEEKPMLFEADFFSHGYHLVYGFEVMCNLFKKGSRSIVSETLSVVTGKSNVIKLYERNDNKVSMMKDKKALDIIKFDAKLLNEFENKINTNLDRSALFLTGAFKSTISSKVADAVIDYFRNKLVVVSDFALKSISLTVSIEKMPQKDFLMWNDTLDGFVKNADFGPQSIAFKPKKTENKDLADMELVSIYKRNDEAIELPAELMESRGTLKLLDFAIPFETLFENGGVFVLDEFDAAIHPELVKGILALFNDQTVNSGGAQLIFTTHNPIYLNNRIFRRDQIRFVEKDKDTYESVIFSLADFGSMEVRNDENYLINFFKGKYGALPFIDFSRLIGNNNSRKDG